MVHQGGIKMTEKFTAKSVEEAKALAAKKFGKSIREIKFEILEEGKYCNVQQDGCGKYRF